SMWARARPCSRDVPRTACPAHASTATSHWWSLEAIPDQKRVRGLRDRRRPEPDLVRARIVVKASFLQDAVAEHLKARHRRWNIDQCEYRARSIHRARRNLGVRKTYSQP